MGTTLEMMTDATIKEILEKVDPKTKEGKETLALVKEIQTAHARITTLEDQRDFSLWNEALEEAAREVDVLARSVGNNYLAQAATQAYIVASESIRKLKK